MSKYCLNLGGKIYEFNKNQEKFLKSKKKYVGYIGARACVAGNTRIWDAENKKHRLIKDLYKEKKTIKVLSFKGGKIVKAQSLVPERYEKERLFKVKTKEYDIVATKEHKFLTKDGWKKLSSCVVGEQLLGFSSFQEESISESFQSVLFSNVFRWTEKAQDLIICCCRVFHLYDVQLLFLKGIFLSSFPLQNDVHGYNLKNYKKGDCSSLLKYTHLYRLFYHPSKQDYSPSFANLHSYSVANYTVFSTYQYILLLSQQSFQFLLKLIIVSLKVLIIPLYISYSILVSFYKFFLTYFYNLSLRPQPHTTIKENIIQEIKYEKTDYYYDLHILGTNNYLAEGLFHHNCGKSLALCIKIIELMAKYRNNHGLIGREDYSDLRDTTERDFFDVCPESLIKSYHKQERKVRFRNGSTLIFRGLKDATKFSIRSLNLGFYALEQAEEIAEGVVDELDACLRRRIVDYNGREGVQQAFYLANPTLNWVWRKFKQEINDEREFIGGSLLDNEKHLSKSFIDTMMRKPERWKKVFVFGQFDEGILADKAVFVQEHVDRLVPREAIRETAEKILIYEEPIVGHKYQIGADPSEGITDNCVAKCIDVSTGREVASFVARLAPDLFAGKIEAIGLMYFNARIVLEINGIGLATLTKLKDRNYPHIFIREEYDRHAKVMTEKLGFRTTASTKPLLIGHLSYLLEEDFVKVSDEKTIGEMKVFVYSDAAKKKGMGAEKEFHDDRVMATALAYWEVKPRETEGDIIIDDESLNPAERDLYHLEEIFQEDTSESWMNY